MFLCLCLALRSRSSSWALVAAALTGARDPAGSLPTPPVSLGQPPVRLRAWPAPNRVKVAPLNARGVRYARPLEAQLLPLEVLFTARLSRPVRRLAVAFAGRRVRLRTAPGSRTRYLGSFELRRGKSRSLRQGRRYRTSVVLCAPRCVRRIVHLRLRGSDRCAPLESLPRAWAPLAARAALAAAPKLYPQGPRGSRAWPARARIVSAAASPAPRWPSSPSSPRDTGSTT